ncbi:MAG: hypothetical protein WDZ83_06580 [Rhizobiaceae bacterium]
MMSDGKKQFNKFREAAREIETDDDEKQFDRALGKVAKAPPSRDDKKNPNERHR